MKLRKGFVSNSSSSSFILSSVYDKQEIHDFVKKAFIQETEKRIAKMQQDVADGNPIIANWESYINRLKEDMSDKNLEPNINITTVQEYLDNEWDLAEWYEMSNIDKNDLILYDVDDNFLNWIDEQIITRFNVKDYCLHMG